MSRRLAKRAKKVHATWSAILEKVSTKTMDFDIIQELTDNAILDCTNEDLWAVGSTSSAEELDKMREEAKSRKLSSSEGF